MCVREGVCGWIEHHPPQLGQGKTVVRRGVLIGIV